MSRDKKLTEAQRQEIVKLYVDGMPLKVIAEAYDIDKSYACQLGSRMGYRRSGKQTKEQAESKTVGYGKKCPHCKAKNPQMAKFCMFCGADVRDEKQILIERVEALRAMTALLPDSEQGKADEITRMVLKYLGGR